MSLAAKLPHKSTAVNETCCQDGPRVGPTEVAEKILEEEISLLQDSIDSSTIETVDEYRSSSGSNSEAEDVTPGFETSKQYGPPSGPGPNILKAKKGTVEDESRRVNDWDSLRKEALYNGEKREQSKDTTVWVKLRIKLRSRGRISGVAARLALVGYPVD